MITDSRTRWLAFAVLSLGSFMIVLDTTIVNVALPSIRTDLGFTEASLAWVVNAYMLFFGGFLLLGGRLGDLYGRRKLFVAGIGIFTAASFAAGISSSQPILVAARAAQGLGGAVVSAAGLSLMMSLFTGMAVLVARFAGANQPEKVNRVVYQAFLTAVVLAVFLAVVGYTAAPALLDIVNAAPEVQHQALPFLRAMFLGIFGMMMFFMLSGAFRAAGDPRTPLRLGVAMTVLTVIFNVLLIPLLGTIGAAFGTIASSTVVACYGTWRLFAPGSVIHFRISRSRLLSLIRFSISSMSCSLTIESK